MLQKEMARRISAAPGTSDYGALTLVVQLNYRVEYLRTVPASVFLPAPGRGFRLRSDYAAGARTNCRSTIRKHFSKLCARDFRNVANSCETC